MVKMAFSRDQFAIEGMAGQKKARIRPKVVEGESHLTAFTRVFKMNPSDRIFIIKKGIPAEEAKLIAEKMSMPQDRMLQAIRIPVSTLNRRVSKGEVLTIDEGERLVNLSALIGLVETMVNQSGNPDGFDAAKWVAVWIQEPNPALNNRPPAEYLDTSEGFKVVTNILSAMLGGSYL